jgi:hypothetical protein
MSICLAHMQAKSVDSVRSIMLYILPAGIFLLDANMKLVLLFHLLVAIQSIQVPTQVCSPSLPTNISYSICLHLVTCN